jgi:hypothetical protein
MRNAVVVDINGTLSDVSRVVHMISGAEKDWEGFFDAMNSNRVPVNKMVKEFIDLVRPRYAVVLVSGAPDRYRAQTEQWLLRHRVHFDDIHFRPEWDKRRGWQYKKTLYEKKLKNIYNVKLVLDDKEDACRTWTEHGLQCWKLPSDMDRANVRSTEPGKRFAHLVKPSRVRR